MNLLTERVLNFVTDDAHSHAQTVTKVPTMVDNIRELVKTLN